MKVNHIKESATMLCILLFPLMQASLYPTQPKNGLNRLNSFQQIIQERLKNAVEIYYETSVHKKFLADVYVLIPKGRKCAIWFIQKQCWMFQIAKRPYTPGGIATQRDTVLFDEVRMINMPLMDDSWYAGLGTIIYGTSVSEKQNDVRRRFSVENVHYLCGVKQTDDGTLNRFTTFFDAYAKHLGSTTRFHFQLCMPIMHTNFNDAMQDAAKITTYEVFCIQHRFLNRACTEYKNLLMNMIDAEPAPTPKGNPVLRTFFPKQANVFQQQTQTLTQTHAQFTPQQTPPIHPVTCHKVQQRTFIIRPDAQNDIYYVLRSLDEPITSNTMIAHIPNYKTSVMMNEIFRNIKENRNLDALEESDDEDEDNVPLVDLNKWVRMSCTFNSRFRRWQPVGLQPV